MKNTPLQKSISIRGENAEFAGYKYAHILSHYFRWTDMNWEGAGVFDVVHMGSLL